MIYRMKKSEKKKREREKKKEVKANDKMCVMVIAVTISKKEC